MRTCLTQEEMNRLHELGFCNNDGSVIGTLDELLEMIPKEIEVYRYRPEDRREGMSQSTYCINLEINYVFNEWIVGYGDTCFDKPDCVLVFVHPELIRGLYLLVESYMTAPKEWVCKK